jgi:hypothetical protein
MFNRKAYDQTYYQSNKDQRLKYNRDRRVQLKLRLLEYLKVHPCIDCRITDPVVLEFDHVEEKDNEIMRMVHACYSWSRIETELKKCEVRCANCHRRRTYKQFGYRKWETAGQISTSEI